VRRFLLIVAAMLLGAYSMVASAQLVGEIIIEGNQKTRSGIIRQELLFSPGDRVDDPLLEQSRQAVMDLGLFRRVEIRRETEGEVTRLIVTVKEKKHDWYILPRIERNADGDITLGINWRANNLRGLNQSSKLTLVNKEYHQATKNREYRLDGRYSNPRILNTRYSGYAYFKVAQSGLDEERDGLEGSYDREESVLGVGVGKWLSSSRSSSGLHASLGLEYQRFKHEHLNGEPGLFDDVTELSLIGSVSYRRVHDLLYSRKGYVLGMSLRQANEAIGADRPYFHKYAFYRHYWPLPWRAHTNFNVQLQAASGDHSLFGEPIYELSGSRTLRGYKRETLEGDAYFLVNTQFLTPIFGKNSLRAGVLFDFGNVYQSFSQIKDLEFESSVGVSLRWKLKQWVNTDIRLDIAQGLGDQGEARVYVSGDVFF
jgi:outer membrane protein assembly factor BamA